jgi:hypothetical protein
MGMHHFAGGKIIFSTILVNHSWRSSTGLKLFLQIEKNTFFPLHGRVAIDKHVSHFLRLDTPLDGYRGSLPYGAGLSQPADGMNVRLASFIRTAAAMTKTERCRQHQQQ